VPGVGLRFLRFAWMATVAITVCFAAAMVVGDGLLAVQERL
jgi:hypothetical protein